jgi:hypothetical protein
MMKGLGPKPVLPSKPAMKQLDASQRTIIDYAKATPLMQSDEEPASILQLMRKPVIGG